jgi:hypothetical protein
MRKKKASLLMPPDHINLHLKKRSTRKLMTVLKSPKT